MRDWRNIFVRAALVVLVFSAEGVFAERGASTAPSLAATAPGVVGQTPQTQGQFWFGVAVENIPPAIARQLKLNANQGLMVYRVLPDSPAQKAGLQAEDILFEINGQALTSQEDLFRAANPAAPSGSVAEPRLLRASKVTYLRGGNPTAVEIVPAPRPANMIIFGDTETPQKVLNYVAPTGGGAEIGPGMRIDLSRQPGNFTVQSIKGIVSKGETIILSQETDGQGVVKNTITVGNAAYTVDAAHLEALPAELRPFAQQLVGISGPGAQSQPGARPGTSAAASASLEQRLRDLENQNAQLQKRVKDLEKDKGK